MPRCFNFTSLALRESQPYPPASQGFHESRRPRKPGSRVVPGISVTIARSCSSRRLNKLLLPTFGRPTIASVSPAMNQAAVSEAIGQCRWTHLPDRRETSQDFPMRATLMSSSAKSIPASSSEINSSSSSLTGAMRGRPSPPPAERPRAPDRA